MDDPVAHVLDNRCASDVGSVGHEVAFATVVTDAVRLSRSMGSDSDSIYSWHRVNLKRCLTQSIHLR